MLAVSTMASLLYSLKTLLVQFDGESYPLTQAFGGIRNQNALNEEFSFYNRKGLDEVWDKAQVCKIGKEEIDDNVVNVRHTNLYYMPPSRRSQTEQKTEFNDAFLKMLLNGMESFESINFIDCMKGKHPLQERLFADCDIIVVNLFQGMDYLDEIMDNMDIRKKAVFVVGRYDKQSRDSLGNIRRKYNIAKDSIGVVPYNIHFHDAVHEGRLVPFITKGIFNKKTDEDYDFIMALYHTTNMILRKAGYEGL
jgi:hypothetical protein